MLVRSMLPIIFIKIYPYLVLFSAELVLEEKIEYNDLVKSIQDGNSSNDDERSNVQTTQPDKQKDVATKNGKSKKDIYIYIILFLIASILTFELVLFWYYIFIAKLVEAKLTLYYFIDVAAVLLLSFLGCIFFCCFFFLRIILCCINCFCTENKKFLLLV